MQNWKLPLACRAVHHIFALWCPRAYSKCTPGVQQRPTAPAKHATSLYGATMREEAIWQQHKQSFGNGPICWQTTRGRVNENCNRTAQVWLSRACITDCMRQLSGHEDSTTGKANKARDLSRQVQIQLSSCSGLSYPLTTYGCIRVGKHGWQGRRELPGRLFAAIDIGCISCTVGSPKACHLSCIDCCGCPPKETSPSKDFTTPLLTLVLQWDEKLSFLSMASLD